MIPHPFLKTELQADEEIAQEKVLNQFYSDANTTIVITLLNIISLFIHVIITILRQSGTSNLQKKFLAFHFTHY